MKRAYLQNSATNEIHLMRVTSLKKVIYQISRIIVLTFIAGFWTACERDLVFDTTSVTEPSLTVVAETMTGSGTTTTYTKINGAVINLYNNQADFNANAAPFKSKTTDQQGKASFTKADLVQKGVFYVRATSGSAVGTGTTPYILLNDGETVLHVVLQ